MCGSDIDDVSRDPQKKNKFLLFWAGVNLNPPRNPFTQRKKKLFSIEHVMRLPFADCIINFKSGKSSNPTQPKEQKE